MLVFSYAFLEFKSVTDAQAAVKKLTGKVLDGKALVATQCSERLTDQRPDWKKAADRSLDDFDLQTLFVCRLPRFTERTELAQIFRKSSNIKFNTLPDGTCRG